MAYHHPHVLCVGCHQDPEKRQINCKQFFKLSSFLLIQDKTSPRRESQGMKKLMFDGWVQSRNLFGPIYNSLHLRYFKWKYYCLKVIYQYLRTNICVSSNRSIQSGFLLAMGSIGHSISFNPWNISIELVSINWMEGTFLTYHFTTLGCGLCRNIKDKICVSNSFARVLLGIKVRGFSKNFF